MPQLVESIHLLDGEMPLLALHNERCNLSRQQLYDIHDPIDLREYIHIGPYLSRGEFKCRIVYDQEIREISYQAYRRTKISSVSVIHTSDLNYRYKFANRKNLDVLYHQRKQADEIIIVNNGKISDAYYYNLAFWDGSQWLTPSDNLLDGVMRSSLIASGKIKSKSLSVKDLSSFQKVSFINALNGLGAVEIPIQNIIY